ncbi:hypothetical protein SODALDRAFT_353821 [Sodiomyces alkalinus F11]|uniref:Caspase domain-containing protein n=1 Tax=Sodiomyces alkalinus (strain CBS 110278 / VKM F-3762 / F11) TaxID=1314773 RepID=A0A3N2PIZ5_SODAK|nr:hypothetical protein SODALDRAFT_353821 [Sodiomyces alkalinus F11]ROT34513.1 hypothetical protein SODALDRAFT_353821 [Sodiomyces alkalinus F11]
MTHPADAFKKADMTVDEFKERMQEACANYFGPGIRHRRYANLRVLCVAWATDLGPSGEEEGGSLHIGPSRDSVYDIFVNSYKYTGEALNLPYDEASANALFQDALSRLLKDLGEDDLAILYYIGHGVSAVLEQEHGLLLHPSMEAFGDPVPKVDFHGIRTKMIDPAKTHVLMLMDCCCAAGGALGIGKELIAASAHNQPAYGGDTGFTFSLVHHLQLAFKEKHILSTAELVCRLTTRALLPSDGQPRLETMPHFLRSYEDAETNKTIYLTPDFHHDDWTPGAIEPLFTHPVQFRLRVYLGDANESTERALKAWLLENRPHNVKRVEIQDIVSFKINKIIITMIAINHDSDNHVSDNHVSGHYDNSNQEKFIRRL